MGQEEKLKCKTERKLGNNSVNCGIEALLKIIVNLKVIFFGDYGKLLDFLVWFYFFLFSKKHFRFNGSFSS